MRQVYLVVGFFFWSSVLLKFSTFKHCHLFKLPHLHNYHHLYKLFA